METRSVSLCAIIVVGYTHPSFISIFVILFVLLSIFNFNFQFSIFYFLFSIFYILSLITFCSYASGGEEGVVSQPPR